MKRYDLLERLRAAECWDLIVVGGGATGLGTAVDAAARGYRTLVLDAHDFAKGTSSRSTKLVHGGLRYLAQGRIGLVREALHERGLLQRNAPHLVHRLGFIIPAYTRWAMPYYGLGLKLYDLLAGRLGLGVSHAIGREEVLQHVPTLEPSGLRGGLLYFDGQFDDARLAITLMRTVFDLGGTAVNYVAVTGLIKESGRVAGVVASDAETGEEFLLRARVVVNATGVYADTVRQLDDPTSPTLIAPSQGIHLVLERSFLPGDCAVMIPRTDDGRVLFAIPWHGRAIIGTTDTPVTQLPIEPRPLPGEIDFLLRHAARYLSRGPTPSDVLSLYAGLRPLVRSGTSQRTSELSRGHKLIVSTSGLVTIIGGKWTTYRRMADDAVTQAATVAGLTPRACPTESLRLHGWQEDSAPEACEIYGSESENVRRLLGDDPAWSEPLHPRLPYRAGEAVWAARYELARNVEDVLARRTRALLLDAHASIEAAPRVASLLAAELGRDPAWQQAQVRAFEEQARGYIMKY
ncbi:MAG TPA: glycerol-3-phosphate dehydrogenase/oxidase [Isosphaeraceae bacterium]|jgi:glycerol-3-phosphate dehydrogenase|nr:glycerol-3-phosphate dehydrogenase/oxidase [Isosphaeraceae bacterium]